MFGEEIRKLLFQVITSWQVLAVTVLLVIYIFLVNYVANIYYRPNRPRTAQKTKKKADTAKTPAAVSPAPQQEEDELGLEDEPPAE